MKGTHRDQSYHLAFKLPRYFVMYGRQYMFTFENKCSGNLYLINKDEKINHLYFMKRYLLTNKSIDLSGIKYFTPIYLVTITTQIS